MTKRKKDAVLLSVTDSDELVSVDRQLLIDSGSRLGLALKYDGITESHMTKPMLLTFMRSLLHGQLSLGRGVSVQEALSTFEYEGISIGGAPPAISQGTTVAHHATSISDEIIYLSERLANNIVAWPRLAKTCRNSIFGKGSFSATPTRVWVRLLTKPYVRIRGNGSYHSSIITEWPLWLSESLAYIATVHNELVMEGVIQPHACDEATLKLMTERLSTREYLSHSAHDGLSTTHEVKRWRIRIERFVHDIRSVLLEPADYPQEAHVFAKTCLDLCLVELDATPSHAHVYSQMSNRSTERSTERIALCKALKARGVQLVTWASEEVEATLNPVGFPPMWPSTSNDGPCLLLDIGS